MCAVFVGVGKDLAANACTDFAEVITNTRLTWCQWDARDFVIGQCASRCAVAVFAIGVRGWLGFGNCVRASFEVSHKPVACCIGGCSLVDSAARVCDGNSHIWQAWFACVLHAVVVVITVYRTCQAGNGITEVADSWDDRTWGNRDRQAVRGARAESIGLGFDNRVLACWDVAEGVIAICVGSCGSWLYAWSVGVRINIVARSVF